MCVAVKKNKPGILQAILPTTIGLSHHRSYRGYWVGRVTPHSCKHSHVLARQSGTTHEEKKFIFFLYLRLCVVSCCLFCFEGVLFRFSCPGCSLGRMCFFSYFKISPFFVSVFSMQLFSRLETMEFSLVFVQMEYHTEVRAPRAPVSAPPEGRVRVDGLDPAWEAKDVRVCLVCDWFSRSLMALAHFVFPCAIVSGICW